MISVISLTNYNFHYLLQKIHHVKSLRHLRMEPKRAKRGWLDLRARCIVITDMDLRTNHVPYISVALPLENGFTQEKTKGRNRPFLIAQVRKCI